MDERSLLKMQIQTLLQQLGRAERALELPQIYTEVCRYVRDDLEKHLQTQRQGLENLKKMVERNVSLDTCWSEFRPIRDDCSPIFRECLAFQQGMFTRTSVPYEGYCDIADALLDDLSKRAGILWERFTIMTYEESYTGMAQMIRLSFPQVNIWDLPVAAHEFGHFVAHEMEEKKLYGTDCKPFQEFVQEEERKNKFLPEEKQIKQINMHLQELFADLFATYTTGPAYACTCMLLRFDPGEAYMGDSNAGHPNDSKRAYFILEALKKMNSAQRMLPYTGIINGLQILWPQERLDQESRVQLNYWLDRMYNMLHNYLLQKKDKKDIQYSGWSRAYTLSNKLLSDIVQLLNDEEYTLSDVLNGAWLFRLEHWKSEDIVEKANKNALNLCTLIIQRGISNGS